jgi:hypothetical protein
MVVNIFSNLNLESLVDILEAKHTKMWGLFKGEAPPEMFSLMLSLVSLQ